MDPKVQIWIALKQQKRRQTKSNIQNQKQLIVGGTILDKVVIQVLSYVH